MVIRYLTVAEAAARLGYVPSRVRQLCQSGQLAATRHGQRVWLIPETAVIRFARPARGWRKGRPRKPRE
jgi:excisionase family DNA binding protein